MGRWNGDESETHFINVDLDIWSKRSLAPLVEAFGSKVFLLHEGWEDPLYGAHLEMCSTVERDGAEARILQFVEMIENLPPGARRRWNAAERREFNIGLQGAYKPRSYELRLKDSTLAMAARVKAGVVITIYAAGKHFHGAPGEPPQEVFAPGEVIGPTRAEVAAALKRSKRK